MKIHKSVGIALSITVAAFVMPAIAADIVMYDALDFASGAAKAFTAKTGVTVDIVEPGGTGETLGKIAAEGDNPQFDIVWVDGSAVMERMLQNHVLQAIPADFYTSVKFNDLGKSLLPASRAFLPTGASTTAIEVNTKKVPADQMPKSWADLEKFAGSVASKDPNLSGPMYQWLAGVFQTEGVDAAKAMLGKILTNKALSGFASGGPVDKSVLTGDAKVGINQDSSIYAKIATGEPVVAIYPTEGSVALPASIGISAKAKHMDAIKKFVDFMTSPEGQAAMMNGGDTDFFFIPIIQGVTAKPGRKIDIPFVVLDDKLASAHETEWKTWYKDNFVQ